MPTSVQTTRPLGEQERLLNYLHGFGGLIVLQVLHIRGRLEPELVRKGLSWLQRHHPMARAHVRQGGIVFRKYPPFAYRQPWFDLTDTGKIPLRVINTDWREALSDELSQPLKGRQSPRLRLTLVEESGDGLTHLLICADHSSIDALSCNLLARELLEYLADPASKEAQKPADEGLPPPLEEGMPNKSRSGKRGYQPAIRLPVRKKEQGHAATRVVKQTIAPEQHQRLKHALLANRTSTHGALTAAFLLAIRDRYGLGEMTCLSTVDLRRMCKPAVPKNTFGCYIDILRTRHDLKNDFWPLAREVSFSIISTLSRDQEVASLLKLPDWEVYAKEAISTMRSERRIDGLAITTAGDSGLVRTYGNLILEDVSMAVSLDVFGASIMVIACERLGALDLCLCYATRAICREDVEDLGRRALAHLAEQSGGEFSDGQAREQ